MKIEVLRTVLPWVVGAVIPGFFVMTYVLSAYHRLGLSCARCRETWNGLLARLQQRQDWLSARLARTSAAAGGCAAGPDQARALFNGLQRLLDAQPQGQKGWWECVPLVVAAKQPFDALLWDLVSAGWDEDSKTRLEQIEGALTAAIEGYNQAVTGYLSVRGRFPVSVVATVGGFCRPPLFPRVGKPVEAPASHAAD